MLYKYTSDIHLTSNKCIRAIATKKKLLRYDAS